MPGKSFTYYLVKAVRISGWFLLGLVLLFLVSGYSMCGEFGFDRLVGSDTALTIHKAIDIPLLVFFLIHAVAATYLAFRRWGWIKGSRKT